ncbi:MAG: phosphate/phosphite/phosphonate ABC transporter substrate-binding protein [Acidobacteriota bacterium]
MKMSTGGRGKWWWVVLASSSLVLWFGCGGDGPSSGEASAPAEGLNELTLAAVGSYPAAAVVELRGLVAWLNERLADDGWRVGIRIAGSVPEVAQWLGSGEADLYMDSPHPILLARHLSDCRPILRRWKFGSPTYDSQIFVREDSGIRDLEGLRGQTIAFEDRYSSSSFFLPMDLLISRGLEGSFLGQAEDPVPPEQLGFVFSDGDSNTMHWVLAGKVTAGAMNRWNVDHLADAERDQLRILATTAELPRHLIAARSGLDPVAEARIRELLMSAHETEEGRAMLAEFSSTDRFDDIPAEFLADIDRIQAGVVRLDELVTEAATNRAAAANRATAAHRAGESEEP